MTLDKNVSITTTILQNPINIEWTMDDAWGEYPDTKFYPNQIKAISPLPEGYFINSSNYTNVVTFQGSDYVSGRRPITATLTGNNLHLYDKYGNEIDCTWSPTSTVYITMYNVKNEEQITPIVAPLNYATNLFGSGVDFNFEFKIYKQPVLDLRIPNKGIYFIFRMKDNSSDYQTLQASGELEGFETFQLKDISLPYAKYNLRFISGYTSENSTIINNTASTPDAIKLYNKSYLDTGICKNFDTLWWGYVDQAPCYGDNNTMFIYDAIQMVAMTYNFIVAFNVNGNFEVLSDAKLSINNMYVGIGVDGLILDETATFETDNATIIENRIEFYFVSLGKPDDITTTGTISFKADGVEISKQINFTEDFSAGIIMAIQFDINI